MNKFQAMAQIMSLLNQDDLLKPGSQVYKMVRRMVSEKIDRFGPDRAVTEVLESRTELLDKIKILAMWHKTTRR